MRRIPSLDGLRAISIMLVIVGHWSFQALGIQVAGSYARLGVRIFFVISGYLITTLLVREHAGTNDISLRRFYIRRSYRIFPAAAFFICVTFVIFWRELRWVDIAAALFYFTNFVPAPPWAVAHLWSLSVEEQFYLLWPSVLKRWYAHRVKILVFVLFLAPFCSGVGYFLRIPGFWRSFPAVADNLAVGCLLAVIWDRLPVPRRKHALLAVLMVAFIPLVIPDTRWRTLAGVFVLLPLLYVAISCIVLYVIKKPPRFLNGPAIVWLGQISYSVYLWQQLFVSAPKPHPCYWMMFPVFAGAASYYLIEQPALRLRETRNSHPAVPAAAQLAAAGD